MKIPLLAIVLAGCAPGPASPYEAQQAACVANEPTRAAADACRCAVKARFGNPCANDVSAPPADAGSDR
jgi:hypothetical protein